MSATIMTMSKLISWPIVMTLLVPVFVLLPGPAIAGRTSERELDFRDASRDKPDTLDASKGGLDSMIATEAFYYHTNLDGGGDTTLSGLEVRWLVGNRDWVLSFAVPALSLSGPDEIMLVGPGIASSAPDHGGSSRPGTPQGTDNGSGTGKGGSGGSGGGSGGNSGTPMAAGTGGLETTTLLSPARETGLGDLRIQFSRRLGQGTGAGRFHVRGGAKVPTADESRGLGTGQLDAWAGAGWRREGWTTDIELALDWVYLGDTDRYALRDGPAGSVLLGWPIGAGGLRTGIEAARGVLPGDSARVVGVAEAYGRFGRSVGWSAEVTAGLTDTAPDLGIAATLRY